MGYEEKEAIERKQAGSEKKKQTRLQTQQRQQIKMNWNENDMSRVKMQREKKSSKKILILSSRQKENPKESQITNIKLKILREIT